MRKMLVSLGHGYVHFRIRTVTQCLSNASAERTFETLEPAQRPQGDLIGARFSLTNPPPLG